MARYIFITGGVVSSLGKGLAAAALGALLQARGFTVRLRKLDPYLNVDPGTMSPFEHGEVFVTDDGAETDLDLGHYERFTGVAARMTDSVSSGRIYSTVLEKERRGDYLGKTIQVVPHVTDEIKQFLKVGDDEVDYGLYVLNTGSAYTDLEIMQTPVFEAFTQTNANINYGLLSYTRNDLLYLPELELNNKINNAVHATGSVYYLAANSETTTKLTTAFGDRKYRLDYWIGVGAANLSVAVSATILGFFIADYLSKDMMIGLAIVNPVYFMCVMVGAMKTIQMSLAVLLGGLFGILFYFVSPEWCILFGGFTAGTLAFFMGELNDN